MYILLVGYPPFGGPTDNATLRRVRKGQYTFTGPNWDGVSEDAKHCIKRMLLMKPASRATAAQLLEEKWFKHASAVSDRVCSHCFDPSYNYLLRNIFTACIVALFLRA